MKKIIFTATILITSKLFAEPVEPLAPTVFAPWSTDLRNSDGSPYPGKKGGYALTLENKNNKTIFCRDTTFVAALDEWSNSCGSIVASTTINFGNANQTLEILPGPADVYFKADVGNSERLELENKSGLILEFCDRQALMKNFRCGFNCETENRKFDERWDENITGGTKKYRCENTGTKKRTEDPVSCNAGFLKDAQNDRCIPDCGEGSKPNPNLTGCEPITCAGGITVGNYRTSTVFDDQGRPAGVQREVCLKTGYFDSPTTECSVDYRKAGTSACVHKSAYDEYYLANQHGDCWGAGAVTGSACVAAASRWCSVNYGYSVGLIQQFAGNNVGVGCFRGDTEVVPVNFTVNRSWGPVSLDIRDTRHAQTFCKELRGKHLGVVQEIWGDTVTITCLNEDGSVFIPKNDTSCRPGQINEDTISCRHSAASACVRAGFNTGIVTESAPWGIKASCFGWEKSFYREPGFKR
jgi:hypothetical protein